MAFTAANTTKYREESIETMERELTKKTSFLAMTNDAICTAVSKAMRLVSQSPPSSFFEEKSIARRKSALKVDSDDKDCLPEISLDEVYHHDSIYDCWIVVYDRVFDISNFLQEHPGGEEVLMEHAGRDATIAFRGVGHSHEAFKALEQYLIGILPEKERLYNKGGKRVLEMITTSLGMGS